MIDTTELMKFYKETRLSPSTISDGYTTDRAAVNCVALITSKHWEDVVRSLVEQAHYRGNMPSYRTCITDLFRKSGFAPVRYSGRISKFLEECKARFEAKEKYIIKTSYGYFAVVPDETIRQYLFKGLWPSARAIRDCWVDELWIYVPGTDNRTGIKRAIKERYIPKETTSLEFKNMNPENKNTGDCSVRGLSAAYGCTWHEAIDHIANTICFSDPRLNTISNINITLIKLGFERHKPIKRGNKFLNGKQFCELMDHTYFAGERIFAYVGRSHCAAVLPIRQEDGTVRYKIQDTWDSTSRYIGEWFVYKEPAVMPKEENKPLNVVFKCGDKVQHPRFGEGTILSVSGSDDSKILEIQFEKEGLKKISAEWLKNQGFLENRIKTPPPPKKPKFKLS